MDATEALTDLMEISAQIDEAVLVEGDGVAASTVADGGRATELARLARDLLDGAAALRSEAGGVQQVEVTTAAGGFFVVRDDDRTLAATTGPQPTVGLVVYDLKTCLRNLATDDAALSPAPAGPELGGEEPGDAP